MSRRNCDRDELLKLEHQNLLASTQTEENEFRPTETNVGIRSEEAQEARMCEIKWAQLARTPSFNRQSK